VGIKSVAIGLITEAYHAEHILGASQADSITHLLVNFFTIPIGPSMLPKDWELKTISTFSRAAFHGS